MRKESCLQQLTGSCASCSVLAIAKQNLQRRNYSISEVARKAQAEYCPDGVQMQTHHLRISTVIRPMGQVK